MRAVRIASSILVLVITPASAVAQAGITPLMTSPLALESGGSEFGGYVTIENEIDLFGVYRRGVGQGLDFGLRGGYTSAGDGGLHLGGDLRFGLAGFNSGETSIPVALVGGLQLSFMDFGNLISVPFGASIGVELGSEERPLVLYGLPYLDVVRIDPDNRASNTELEFGVELAGEVFLASKIWALADLNVSSHDDDNVSLALGIIIR